MSELRRVYQGHRPLPKSQGVPEGEKRKNHVARPQKRLNGMHQRCRDQFMVKIELEALLQRKVTHRESPNVEQFICFEVEDAGRRQSAVRFDDAVDAISEQCVVTLPDSIERQRVARIRLVTLFGAVIEECLGMSFSVGIIRKHRQ